MPYPSRPGGGGGGGGGGAMSYTQIVHPCSDFYLRSRLGFYIPFIYLFGVLRRFQHCTGHITTGSWKGRGHQYI